MGSASIGSAANCSRHVCRRVVVSQLAVCLHFADKIPKKLWTGPFDSLRALGLVLVIGRVVHAVEALLYLDRVHSILIALLALLLLETDIPCLIGAPLDRQAKGDDK